MAFAGLNFAKEDAPRRTAEGERHLVLPPHSETEVPIPISGTDGIGAIGIEPSPGDVYKFDDKYRLTADDVMRVQAAIFWADYIANGYIGDSLLYNVGEADNATHAVQYEIVSASGQELTLRGPDPHAVEISTFKRNPETGFLEPIVSEVAIPNGAAVEFLYPSVYADRRNVPVILSWGEATAVGGGEVEVTVQTSAVVGSALVGWRTTGASAGPIFCKVRFEGTHAGNWIWAEEPEVGYFARQLAEGVTSNTFALVGSDGSGGRALYPGMVADAVVVLIERADGSVIRVPDSAVRDALTTSEAGHASLDLGALKGTGFVGASIAWWGEADAADFAAGEALPFNVTGWAPDDPDAWGLSDGVNVWGSPNPAMGDIGGDWLSRIWHQANWVLEQGVPGEAGHRNFKLVKVGGPSYQALVGGWRDDVPEGLFALREQFFGPRWGIRVTWTDAGDQYQRLVHGAFYRRAYDFASDGGPTYAWEAGATPLPGGAASVVEGWAAGKASGDRYPYRLTGRVNVHTFAHGGAGMRRTNELQVDSEYYVRGLG